MTVNFEKLGNKRNVSDYIPKFYRLNNDSDSKLFYDLVKNNSQIIIHDQIIGQVEELVKSLNPKTIFTKSQLTEAAYSHIGSIPIEQYGVWVYYPWSNNLVHILDEEDFVNVRTNRNQYKITPEEEKLLQKKKIGIIGLSVGQSIALTIAMERICGELRIADFDELELSNLNRIRAGVHSLGVPKTIVVAREIAEIDPFLKVVLYSEGLTHKNADDFFTKDGNLDICIEVCDGLQAKIMAREKAKALGIAVVMNSSDRGTTDVERYDINPKQPILHGLIDHLDLNLVKDAKTNEEKVPYLLPMLGLETSTSRLKASMIEIQETITTWPQLASGVILGGGICTDVCRRILLNQFTKSGRYIVDLEDIINNETVDFIAKSKNKTSEYTILPKADLNDYRFLIEEAKNKGLFLENNHTVDLTEEQLNVLLTSATSAPSGGNMQPWEWYYNNKRLFLFHNKTRSESILNYNNFAAFIAFGAALENLSLSAKKLNLKLNTLEFPLGKEKNLIAILNFEVNTTIKDENGYDIELEKSILKRITNRTIGQRTELNITDRKYLQYLANDNAHFGLEIISDENKMNELKNIVARIDQLYLRNKNGNFCFSKEMRWSKEEVALTNDGIDLETIDITPTEKAGMLVAKNWDVTKYTNEWGLGAALGKHSKKSIDSASALAVVTANTTNDFTYLDAGRVIERIWLGATHKNLAFQPMSIPTFLWARVTDVNFDGVEDIKDELLLLNNKFRSVFDLKENQKEIFFFRLSKADKPKVSSLRRNIKDVLLNG